MTSQFADNILCAVFAKVGDNYPRFGDCNFRYVTLVTLYTFERKRKK